MEALRQNWKAKVMSLILATVVWWLIKSEMKQSVITAPPPPVKEAVEL